MPRETRMAAPVVVQRLDTHHGLVSAGTLKVATPQRSPSYSEAMMRFYTQQHRFYAGIDLHARTLHLCILEHDGNVVFDRNLVCRPDVLLHALAPFREGLVIGVECMFAWYWVADLCVQHDATRGNGGAKGSGRSSRPA